MAWKIGSFNLKNLSESSIGKKSEKDIATIAKIIKDEDFDVVALQEILSDGKALNHPDSEHTKKSLLMELPPGWDFEYAEAQSKSDPRNEGYAFLWKKTKLRLCTAKDKNGIIRTFKPRICQVNKEWLERKPFYGRFTAKDILGGTNVEFRLICVHTYFGKDNALDREKRIHELEVLLKDIYPQLSDKRYGDPMKAYTILLGDYNAELWTKKSRKWQEPLKKLRNEPKPCIIKTDSDGYTVSERYNGRKIKTVQDQLTTLKSKEEEIEELKYIKHQGFSHNYDHFSYEEEGFNGVKVHVRRLQNVVKKYCKSTGSEYESDFDKYRKTISDHIPIMMEIELK